VNTATADDGAIDADYGDDNGDDNTGYPITR
jgi:hypothetical protein